MSDKFSSEEDESLDPSGENEQYEQEDFDEDDISEEQKYWRSLYEDDDNPAGGRSKKLKKKSKFKDKDK